jgi:heterotetrameric sarcosine oxidase delta subunit
MLLIECPSCGARDETEFTFAGEANVVRPDPDAATDAGWAAYLYERHNPKGWQNERWWHAHGCGQWFNLSRHSVTHEIRAVYAIGGAPPAEAEPAEGPQAVAD